MLMHLGMSGSVRIRYQLETGVHDHMILEMDGGHPQWVVFNDPRRFGWIDLFEGDIHPMLAGIPEPLGNAFSADSLAAALDRRTGPINLALLNQLDCCRHRQYLCLRGAVWCGIVAAPACRHVRGARAERLVSAIRSVPQRHRDGGTSLRDHSSPAARSAISCSACGVWTRGRELSPVAPRSRRSPSRGAAAFTVPAVSADVACLHEPPRQSKWCRAGRTRAASHVVEVRGLVAALLLALVPAHADTPQQRWVGDLPIMGDEYRAGTRLSLIPRVAALSRFSLRRRTARPWFSTITTPRLKASMAGRRQLEPCSESPTSVRSIPRSAGSADPAELESLPVAAGTAAPQDGEMA